MLDKLSRKLLIKLKSMCNTDGYSIIEVDDIVAQISNKIDATTLGKYIDLLITQEYIDVKYIDDKQICLSILPKSRNINKASKHAKGLQISKSGIIIIAIVSMLGAFVGSILANLLCGVIG